MLCTSCTLCPRPPSKLFRIAVLGSLLLPLMPSSTHSLLLLRLRSMPLRLIFSLPRESSSLCLEPRCRAGSAGGCGSPRRLMSLLAGFAMPSSSLALSRLMLRCRLLRLLPALPPLVFSGTAGGCGNPRRLMSFFAGFLMPSLPMGLSRLLLRLLLRCTLLRLLPALPSSLSSVFLAALRGRAGNAGG